MEPITRALKPGAFVPPASRRIRPRPIPLFGGDRERSLHFIKYMGSKRNLRPVMAPALRAVVPAGGLLLDPFAGTHAIGYALKDHAAIWANDILRYSLPIGETLLCTDPAAISIAEIRLIVPRRAEALALRSLALFAAWVAREREVLAREDQVRGLDAYRLYTEGLAAALPHGDDLGRFAPDLRALVAEVIAGQRTDPPIMAAVYWANAFFSLEQGLWLDAYRQAIDDLLPGHVGRPAALAALLHAAAYGSSGTGHFAQHRKLTSADVLADALRYRERSVADY